MTSLTTPRNTVVQGDCITAMQNLDKGSVDFILTDPPYLVSYKGRDGRTMANDDNARWLKPAFNQMHRVLKPGGFCISFYGWNKVDLFMDAWKAAGFRVVGHIVFRKQYASSARFLRYEHEQAYLLAKGAVTPPACPIPDVIDFPYTGNKLHPTQKPIKALSELILCFTEPGDLVTWCWTRSADRARPWWRRTPSAVTGWGSSWTVNTMKPRRDGWPVSESRSTRLCGRHQAWQLG